MKIKIKCKKTVDEAETPESLKNYSYCSIILDDESQKKLYQAVAGFQVRLPGFQDAKQAGDKKLCHHITINLGKDLKVDGYTHGQEVTFDILKFGAYIDPAGKGVAGVYVYGVIVSGGNPHITCFINGMSPGVTKELNFGATGKITPTLLEDFSLKGLRGFVNIPSQAATQERTV